MEQKRGKKSSPKMRMLKMGSGSSCLASTGPAKVLYLVPWSEWYIYLASGCSAFAMQFYWQKAHSTDR